MEVKVSLTNKILDVDGNSMTLDNKLFGATANKILNVEEYALELNYQNKDGFESMEEGEKIYRFLRDENVMLEVLNYPDEHNERFSHVCLTGKMNVNVYS